MESRLELTQQAVASHFWFRGFRSFVLPALADAAAGRQGLRLLDCGSGTGDNLPLLARHGTVVGIDLSEGGVRRAHQAGYAAVVGDIAGLGLVGGWCDIVTSFDVLQQVPDDRAAVREMARVLRPGGVVVLTVAALDILHGDHNVVWDEVRRYDRRRATELVASAGLTPVRVSYLFASLVPLMLVTRTLQRLTRRFRRISEESDIAVPSAPVNAVLTAVVRTEAWVARRVPMPFGSSLLVVARKPA